MRFPSWRATRPQDPADQAQLQERLTKLTTPPVQDAVAAPAIVPTPISPARAKLQELTGGGAATQPGAPIPPVPTESEPRVDAAPAPAPAVETVVEPAPISAAPTTSAPEPVVALVPFRGPVPVITVLPSNVLPSADGKPERRRRRKLGF